MKKNNSLRHKAVCLYISSVLINKYLYIRTLAVCISAAFFLQQIAYSVTSLPPVSAGTEEKLAAAWGLSEKTARIEEVYDAGAGSKRIIMFQDAHTNTSAQFNLARALDIILEKENIRWVFSEAAIEDNSISFLKELADKEQIRRLAESYLRKSKINGVEYLNLVSDKDFSIWGVEDRDLYLESLKSYFEVYEARKESLNQISRISTVLKILEGRVLNPEILDLYLSRKAFEYDTASSVDYLLKLSALKEKHMKGMNNRVSVIQLLAHIKELESRIDFDKASDELNTISEKMGDQARRVSVYQVNRKTDESIPALHDFLKQHESFLSNSPNLRLYKEYLDLYQDVDLNKFETERKDLEKELFSRLALSTKESDFIRYADAVQDLKSALELKLRSDQYEDLSNFSHYHNPDRIRAYINSLIVESGLSAEHALISEELLQKSVELSKRFYQLTLERDEKFFVNIKNMMSNQGIETGCLIVGGYHSENLKHIFRDKGMSYISILPSVEHETDHEKYERMLLGQMKEDSYRQYAKLSSGRQSAMMTMYARRTGYGSPSVVYEIAEDLGADSRWVNERIAASRLSIEDVEKAINSARIWVDEIRDMEPYEITFQVPDHLEFFQKGADFITVRHKELPDFILKFPLTKTPDDDWYETLFKLIYISRVSELLKAGSTGTSDIKGISFNTTDKLLPYTIIDNVYVQPFIQDYAPLKKIQMQSLESYFSAMNIVISDNVLQNGSVYQEEPVITDPGSFEIDMEQHPQILNQNSGGPILEESQLKEAVYQLYGQLGKTTVEYYLESDYGALFRVIAAFYYAINSMNYSHDEAFNFALRHYLKEGASDGGQTDSLNKIEEDFVEYSRRLGMLHAFGFLEGRVLYPAIGHDYIPSLYADVTGVDLYAKDAALQESLKSLNGILSDNKIPELKSENVKIIEGSIFDTLTKDVLRSGPKFNVLYLKSISNWVDAYKFQFYGFSKPTKEQMQDNVFGWVKWAVENLLEPGGRIIITHEEDADLADRIKVQLGFQISPLMESSNKLQEIQEGGLTEHEFSGIFIGAGEVPLTVLEKRPVAEDPLRKTESRSRPSRRDDVKGIPDVSASRLAKWENEILLKDNNSKRQKNHFKKGEVVWINLNMFKKGFGISPAADQDITGLLEVTESFKANDPYVRAEVDFEDGFFAGIRFIGDYDSLEQAPEDDPIRTNQYEVAINRPVVYGVQTSGSRLSDITEYVPADDKDYSGITLKDFILERYGNGNVIDISGDSNFMIKTAAELSDQGLKFNEVYAMGIGSLSRISDSGSGEFREEIISGKDVPAIRIARDPAASKLERKFSLMFANAPVLQPAQFGTGGALDWVLNARFFGAENSTVLLRLFKQDVDNNRLIRFLRVIDGSIRPNTEPGGTLDLGTFAAQQNLRWIGDRPFQLVGIHEKLPSGLLTTPYTRIPAVPMLELRQTDQVSPEERKALINQTKNLALNAENLNVQIVATNLLIYFGEEARQTVTEDLRRFRSRVGVSAGPFSKVISGKTRSLLERLQLLDIGARLSEVQVEVIPESDPARARWDEIFNQTKKMGGFSLDDLIKQKILAREQFEGLLIRNRIRVEPQSVLLTAIETPYEYYGLTHLLDSVIEQGDRVYEILEEYVLDDDLRTGGSFIDHGRDTSRIAGTGYTVFQINSLWEDAGLSLREKVLSTLTLINDETEGSRSTFSEEVLNMAFDIASMDAEDAASFKEEFISIAENLRNYKKAFILNQVPRYARSLILYHGVQFDESPSDHIVRKDPIYFAVSRELASGYAEEGQLYKVRVPIDSILDFSHWRDYNWEFVADRNQGISEGYEIIESISMKRADGSEDSVIEGARLAASPESLRLLENIQNRLEASLSSSGNVLRAARAIDSDEPGVFNDQIFTWAFDWYSGLNSTYRNRFTESVFELNSALEHIRNAADGQSVISQDRLIQAYQSIRQSLEYLFEIREELTDIVDGVPPGYSAFLVNRSAEWFRAADDILFLLSDEEFQSQQELTISTQQEQSWNRFFHTLGRDLRTANSTSSSGVSDDGELDELIDDYYLWKTVVAVYGAESEMVDAQRMMLEFDLPQIAESDQIEDSLASRIFAQFSLIDQNINLPYGARLSYITPNKAVREAKAAAKLIRNEILKKPYLEGSEHKPYINEVLKDSPVEYIGHGFDSIAVRHRDFPGYVIKLPSAPSVGRQWIETLLETMLISRLLESVRGIKTETETSANGLKFYSIPGYMPFAVLNGVYIQKHTRSIAKVPTVGLERFDRLVRSVGAELVDSKKENFTKQKSETVLIDYGAASLSDSGWKSLEGLLPENIRTYSEEETVRMVQSLFGEGGYADIVINQADRYKERTAAVFYFALMRKRMSLDRAVDYALSFYFSGNEVQKRSGARLSEESDLEDKKEALDTAVNQLEEFLQNDLVIDEAVRSEIQEHINSVYESVSESLNPIEEFFEAVARYNDDVLIQKGYLIQPWFLQSGVADDNPWSFSLVPYLVDESFESDVDPAGVASIQGTTRYTEERISPDARTYTPSREYRLLSERKVQAHIVTALSEANHSQALGWSSPQSDYVAVLKSAAEQLTENRGKLQLTDDATARALGVKEQNGEVIQIANLLLNLFHMRGLVQRVREAGPDGAQEEALRDTIDRLSAHEIEHERIRRSLQDSDLQGINATSFGVYLEEVLSDLRATVESKDPSMVLYSVIFNAIVTDQDQYWDTLFLLAHVSDSDRIESEFLEVLWSSVDDVSDLTDEFIQNNEFELTAIAEFIMQGEGVSGSDLLTDPELKNRFIENLNLFKGLGREFYNQRLRHLITLFRLAPVLNASSLFKAPEFRSAREELKLITVRRLFETYAASGYSVSPFREQALSAYQLAIEIQRAFINRLVVFQNIYGSNLHGPSVTKNLIDMEIVQKFFPFRDNEIQYNAADPDVNRWTEQRLPVGTNLISKQTGSQPVRQIFGYSGQVVVTTDLTGSDSSVYRIHNNSELLDEYDAEDTEGSSGPSADITPREIRTAEISQIDLNAVAGARLTEDGTEPLHYLTKSFPVRFPELNDMILEYLSGKDQDEIINLSQLGAGIDERSPPGKRISPQTIELLAALLGRTSRVRVIDIDENAISAASDLQNYAWYRFPESGRIISNDFRNSSSYDEMRKRLSEITLNTTPETFNADAMGSEVSVYSLNLQSLSGIQINPIQSQFSAFQEYGDSTEDIIVSTVAIAYDLQILDMDARKQLVSRIANSLKPGGIFIIHKDELAEIHPDLKDYPVHLRINNPKVYEFALNDVAAYLTEITGRPFQLSLRGNLVQIRRKPDRSAVSGVPQKSGDSKISIFSSGFWKNLLNNRVSGSRLSSDETGSFASWDKAFKDQPPINPNVSELGYEYAKRALEVISAYGDKTISLSEEDFQESELEISFIYDDKGDLDYLGRGAERFVFRYRPNDDYVIKVPKVRGKITAYYDLFVYYAISALTEYGGFGKPEFVQSAGLNFHKIPKVAPYAFVDGVFVEPYLTEKPEDADVPLDALETYHREVGVDFHDKFPKNFVLYRGEPVVYDIGALRINELGWERLYKYFSLNGKDYPSDQRIKEVISYLLSVDDEVAESLFKMKEVRLGAVMYDAIAQGQSRAQAFETTVLYSKQMQSSASRLSEDKVINIAYGSKSAASEFKQKWPDVFNAASTWKNIPKDSPVYSESINGFRYIDHGWQRIVLEHESLPGYVFKVPVNDFFPYREALMLFAASKIAVKEGVGEYLTNFRDGIEFHNIPGYVPFGFYDGVLIQEKLNLSGSSRIRKDPELLQLLEDMHLNWYEKDGRNIYNGPEGSLMLEAGETSLKEEGFNLIAEIYSGTSDEFDKYQLLDAFERQLGIAGNLQIIEFEAVKGRQFNKLVLALFQDLIQQGRPFAEAADTALRYYAHLFHPQASRLSEVTVELPDGLPPVAVSSFIADLKLQPDNSIKILELGLVNFSAFVGYRQITEQEGEGRGMISDVVVPSLLAETGLPEYKSQLKLNKTQITAPEEFNPDSISTYRGLVTEKFALQRFPGMLYWNDRLRTVESDKALLPELFSDYPELIPETLVLPSEYNSKAAEEIMRQIPSDQYIIKPVNRAQGLGVLLIDAEDLDLTLKTLFGSEKQRIRRSLEGDASVFKDDQRSAFEDWAEDDSPFFIVQRPIFTSKELNGKQYDPTMRAVFSVIREGDRVKFIFHDAYWKLPQFSLDESSGQKALISKVSENQLSGAIVDDAEKAAVESQLRSVIPGIHTSIESIAHHQQKKYNLFSDNDEEIIHGIMHLKMYHLGTGEMIMTERVYSRLEQLAKRSDNSRVLKAIAYLFNTVSREDRLHAGLLMVALQDIEPIFQALLERVPESEKNYIYKTIWRIVNATDVYSHIIRTDRPSGRAREKLIQALRDRQTVSFTDPKEEKDFNDWIQSGQMSGARLSLEDQIYERLSEAFQNVNSSMSDEEFSGLVSEAVNPILNISSVFKRLELALVIHRSVGRVNAEVLMPRGFWIEYEAQIGPEYDQGAYFNLFRVLSSRIESSEPEDIPVIRVSEIFPDSGAAPSSYLGWSPVHLPHVLVNQTAGYRFYRETIRKYLDGKLPNKIYERETPAFFDEQPYHDVIRRLFDRSFNGLSEEESVQLILQSTENHEISHEKRRQQIDVGKEIDNFLDSLHQAAGTDPLGRKDADEILAELDSILETDNPYHIIGLIVYRSLFPDSSRDGRITLGLTGLLKGGTFQEILGRLNEIADQESESVHESVRAYRPIIQKRWESLSEGIKRQDSGSRLSYSEVVDQIRLVPFSIGGNLRVIREWLKEEDVFPYDSESDVFGEELRNHLYDVTGPLWLYAFYRAGEVSLSELPLDVEVSQNESGINLQLNLNSYDPESEVLIYNLNALRRYIKDYGLNAQVTSDSASVNIRFEISDIPSFIESMNKTGPYSIYKSTRKYPIVFDVQDMMDKIKASNSIPTRFMSLNRKIDISGEKEFILNLSNEWALAGEGLSFVFDELYKNAVSAEGPVSVSGSTESGYAVIRISNRGEIDLQALYELAQDYAKQGRFRQHRSQSRFAVIDDEVVTHLDEYSPGDWNDIAPESALEILKELFEADPYDLLFITGLSLKTEAAKNLLGERSLKGRSIGGIGIGLINSREEIRKLGGSLNLRNEDGFVVAEVRIPAAQPDAVISDTAARLSETDISGLISNPLGVYLQTEALPEPEETPIFENRGNLLNVAALQQKLNIAADKISREQDSSSPVRIIVAGSAYDYFDENGRVSLEDIGDIDLKIFSLRPAFEGDYTKSDPFAEIKNEKRILKRVREELKELFSEEIYSYHIKTVNDYSLGEVIDSEGLVSAVEGLENVDVEIAYYNVNFDPYRMTALLDLAGLTYFIERLTQPEKETPEFQLPVSFDQQPPDDSHLKISRKIIRRLIQMELTFSEVAGVSDPERWIELHRNSRTLVDAVNPGSDGNFEDRVRELYFNRDTLKENEELQLWIDRIDFWKDFLSSILSDESTEVSERSYSKMIRELQRSGRLFDSLQLKGKQRSLFADYRVLLDAIAAERRQKELRFGMNPGEFWNQNLYGIFNDFRDLNEKTHFLDPREFNVNSTDRSEFRFVATPWKESDLSFEDLQEIGFEIRVSITSYSSQKQVRYDLKPSRFETQNDGTLIFYGTLPDEYRFNPKDQIGLYTSWRGGSGYIVRTESAARLAQQDNLPEFLSESRHVWRRQIQNKGTVQIPIEVRTVPYRFELSAGQEVRVLSFNDQTEIGVFELGSSDNRMNAEKLQTVLLESDDYTSVDDAVNSDILTATKLMAAAAEFGIRTNPVNFTLDVDSFLGLFDESQHASIARHVIRLFEKLNGDRIASFSFTGELAKTHGFRDFAPFEGAPTVRFWNLNRFAELSDTGNNMPYFAQDNGMLPILSSVAAVSVLVNLKSADQIPAGLLNELTPLFRQLTRSNIELNSETLSLLWNFTKSAGPDAYKAISVKPYLFRGFIDASVYLQRLVRRNVDISA